MRDASRHGTAGIWMKGRANLNPEQVNEIRRRRANGEKLDDIAAAVGSTRKQVSAVALKKIYKPPEIAWPPLNVWCGVSIEDQPTADERTTFLLQTPAAVRFVSCEPLLGPIQFGDHSFSWLEGWETGTETGDDGYGNPTPVAVQVQIPKIDWVIVGGETGPGSRYMDPDWARDIRDQCKAADVPFFMKQMSNKAPIPEDLMIREYPHAKQS